MYHGVRVVNILEANNISYKIGNKYLLKNICLKLSEADNLALIGLNGSGKTTLLSLLAGYLPFSEGKIMCNGPIGLISDSFFSRYYRNETMDTIILSGYFEGLGYKSRLSDMQIKKARELMRLFGIAAKARKPFYLLSKGERQKGLIVRALIHRPKILLLDEPYSGLDVYAQSFVQEIMNYIISEYNVSTIFVTHYLNEITDIYNRAALLKNGMIHSQGKLKDVINTENISDFFNQQVEVIHDYTGMHLKMVNASSIDKSSIWRCFYET